MGAMMAVAAPSMGAVELSEEMEFDENLAVFLSDIHVGSEVPYAFDRLVKAVDDILAMRPRPRNVVVFGDLAHHYGRDEDYALSRPQIERLEKGGVKVTIGMGNHDRRDHFRKFYPDADRKSLVPGLFVSKVSLPHCDILMLDTLEQNSPDGEFCTVADGARIGPCVAAVGFRSCKSSCGR